MKKYRRLHLIVLLGFLLGIHDGCVALWKTGTQDPIRVFPYRAEMLPEADRQLLEKGIPLKDEGELIRLLEDYLS